MLRLTLREMLKQGILYLNDGVWNNEWILPSGWVDKSSTPVFRIIKRYVFQQ